MTDERASLWELLLRRRGGCAYTFIDPLGWGAHKGAWPWIWLARKFRPGSRINMWAYEQSDRVRWRRVKRWMAE